MPDLENLTPRAKQMLDGLRAEALRLGSSFRVTSGYRSPEYQARLRAIWESGDQQAIKAAGLVARPAVSSPHTRGNAVDGSAPPEILKKLGAWAVANGYRWGGNFPGNYDPVHFDTEV